MCKKLQIQSLFSSQDARMPGYCIILSSAYGGLGGPDSLTEGSLASRAPFSAFSKENFLLFKILMKPLTEVQKCIEYRGSIKAVCSDLFWDFFTIAQGTSVPCQIVISVYVDYCSLTVLHTCDLLYVPLPFEILLCFDLIPHKL